MVKVIFGTITVTSIMIATVTALFLNPLLSTFGLVSTSIEAFKSLKASEQIVKRMKKRHAIKRLNFSKRILKRSAKRMSAASIASAGGLPAVMLVMGYFEADAYCQEQEELQADENILFSSNKEFNLKACLIAAKNDSGSLVRTAVEKSNSKVKDVWKGVERLSSNAWKAIKGSSDGLYSSTVENKTN